MNIALDTACVLLLAACTGGADGGTISSSSSGSGGTSSSGGGGSSGTTSGGDGEPTGVTAPCGDAGTSVVSGTLDGKPINVTGSTQSWSWVNVGNPPKFSGSFTGGALQVEWAGTTPNDKVTDITAATLSLSDNVDSRVFQSGQLVYDSGETESWFKASITFDTGTITVCMRKTDK